MAEILVVDDDAHIREVIGFALTQAGYEIRSAADGADALEAALDPAHPPALIVLDVGLPEQDGFEVCRRIRQSSEVPILFLTARDDEVDRVVGLEIGGDDYVTKPFSPRELVARVRAILKRATVPDSEPEITLAHGDLSLDAERHLCRFRGEEVRLTASEFAVLHTLMARPDRVWPKPKLMEAVYGPSIHVSDRTLDSHVRNLRGKLSAAGCNNAIETLHGVGLRLDRCDG